MTTEYYLIRYCPVHASVFKSCLIVFFVVRFAIVSSNLHIVLHFQASLNNHHFLHGIAFTTKSLDQTGQVIDTNTSTAVLTIVHKYEVSDHL